jgi:GntR family transcriptional regulator, uxu operon transcriptional repressor
VREALAALEFMGVVSTHVGAGTYVVGEANGEPVTRTADASPFEILEFRLLLEPRIAQVAARRWDRRTLAAIARPLRALEREAETGSAEHPTLQDRQFHAAIAGATVNTVLIELSRSALGAHVPDPVAPSQGTRMDRRPHRQGSRGASQDLRGNPGARRRLERLLDGGAHPPGDDRPVRVGLAGPDRLHFASTWAYA